MFFRFTVLLFFVFAVLSAKAVDFETNIPPTLSYTETYVSSVRSDGVGGFDVAVSSKLTIIAKCSMKNVDLNAINSFTEVAIDAGDLSFDATLLEADSYVEGDTSATFTLVDDFANPVGKLTLSWNSKYVILGFTVTNDADDYEVESQQIVDTAPSDTEAPTSYNDFPVVDFTFGDRTLETRTLYVTGTVGFTADDRVSDELCSIHLTGSIDSTPPTNLVITSPASGSTMVGAIGEQHTIRGTVADSLGGVGTVQVQLNDGAFQTAHLDTPTSWSLSGVVYTPGKDKLVVQASDVDGNVRLNKPIYFTYSNKSTLTVQADGDMPGKVTSTLFHSFNYVPGTPSPTGTSIQEAGARLTVEAVAGPGAIFAGWTSSAGALPDADSATLKFTMSPSLTLTAHFTVNPFLPILGTYNGLIQSASPAGNGFFSATLTSSGAFTGTVRIGTVTLPLKGKFGVDKMFSGSFTKKGITYQVTLQVNGTGVNGAGQITGTITDGSSLNSTIAADVAGFKKKVNELGEADLGSYNVILPAVQANTDANFPIGIGYGRVTLSKLGAAHFTGKLGDGTAISAGSILSQAKVWPFYAALYGKLGSISGPVTLDRTQTATDLAGTLEWNRPVAPVSPKPKPFATGFAGQLQFVGAKWSLVPGQLLFLTPASGAGTLSFDAPAVVAASLPMIASDNMATLSTTNTVTVTPADHTKVDQIKVTVKPSTGGITGSFVDGAGKTHSFGGMIVSTPGANPKTDAAAGFFTWGTVTGSVQFIEAH